MIVAIGDAKLIREILNHKGSIKPPPLYKKFDTIMNGIATLITSNGDYWHGRRKGAAPAFAANQVNRMNRVALEAADQWIAEKAKAGNEFTFDVSKEMINLLLKSICQTAFEYTLGQEEMEEFKESMSEETGEKAGLTHLIRRTSSRPADSPSLGVGIDVGT